MSGSSIKAGQAYVEIGIRNRIAKGAKGVQADLNRLGRKVTAMGRVMGGAGLALGTPFAFAVTKMASFDDAMRSVGAVSKASEKDLAMLTDTAKELGRTTSFTAVDVASLMTELGRAGFDPGQIDNMTGAVLNLARATGTDATQSAGIMAATIRQYNLEATDAARVSDVLTAAANGSFNSVESLGEALKYAGPVAADLGMSLEETAAILGTLGNVGIQGSMAGTTLKRLTIEAAANADKLESIFGVSMRNAAGEGLPLIDVLEQISVATDGLDQNSRVEKLNAAFGLLGITGASAIGKATGSTKALLKTLQEAAGEAAETTEMMDAGLGGSFRKISSAAEGFAIAVGESVAPAVKKVTDYTMGAIGEFTQWISTNQSLVMALAGSAAAMVAGGAALVALGISAQIAAASIGFMMSPIVLVTASVAGLGFAIAKYTTLGGEAIDWLSNRFGPLVETAKTAVAGITAAIANGDMEKAWSLATELMELAWLDMTGGIRDAWGNAMDWVLDSGSSVAEGLGVVFEALANTLDGLLDSYKSYYDKVYNATEAGLSAAGNYAMGVETIGGAAEPKGSAFDKQFGAQRDALRESIDGVRQFGQNMQEEASGQVADRMAEREAAKEERAKRIEELRLSITTAAATSEPLETTDKEEEKSSEETPAEKLAKDKVEQMRKSEMAGLTLDTSQGRVGDTGSFSAAAAMIIGGGAVDFDREKLKVAQEIAANTRLMTKQNRQNNTARFA